MLKRKIGSPKESINNIAQVLNLTRPQMTDVNYKPKSRYVIVNCQSWI